MKSFDPSLSGLRGLAALSIVIFHSREYIFPVFVIFTSTFYVGVPVFLMLSTYLLLGRLDSNTDLKHYFKRRIVRIWPIYYGSITGIYLYFHIPFWDFVRYLFFVEYYVKPFGYVPANVFWTLQLEELVYLLLPLVARIRAEHKLILGFGLVATGVVSLTISPYFLSNMSYQNPGYLQAFMPIASLSYGFGLIAYCKKIPSWTSICSGIGISGIVWLNVLDPTNEFFSPNVYFFLGNIIFYFITLLGIASIIRNPIRILGWATFLGEESYALYAIHMAFITVFGFAGVVYALICAFLIEFPLRSREIIRRFKIAYSRRNPETVMNSVPVTDAS